jgi:hypothetical protein
MTVPEWKQQPHRRQTDSDIYGALRAAHRSIPEYSKHLYVEGSCGLPASE